MEATLNSIVQMYAEERESNEGFFVITTRSDLDRLRPGGPVGIVLHFEGAKPLAGQLSMLEVYYRIGIRSMQLSRFDRNEAADSVAEKHPGGLTQFGIEVVEAMNELGMLIDLSHMAEPSFWDTIETSRHPVMASHSNAKAVVDHRRNLTDDQIKAIASNDGLVGVVFFPPYVHSGAPTIEHILDQFDYLRDLVGIDHIGIGPDFVDYAPELILGTVPGKTGATDMQFPRGAEDVTKMPNITKGLIRRGYSEEAIRKILGNNMLRVLRQVLKT